MSKKGRLHNGIYVMGGSSGKMGHFRKADAETLRG